MSIGHMFVRFFNAFAFNNVPDDTDEEEPEIIVMADFEADWEAIDNDLRTAMDAYIGRNQIGRNNKGDE